MHGAICEGNVVGQHVPLKQFPEDTLWLSKVGLVIDLFRRSWTFDLYRRPYRGASLMRKRYSLRIIIGP